MDYEERLYRNQSTYGLTWEEINSLLNIKQHYDSTRKSSYGYLKRVDQEKQSNFDKSVMVINDLHLPYEREDIFEIINKHKNEINTLVIAGDLMDCKSISFFPDIRDITLEEELIYTYDFMKKIRKMLDNDQKIITISGNHEERWHKDICYMHEKDMQKFINPHLIDMIIEGFTLYDNGKKRKFDGIEGITYIPHWFVNIDNKLIICHPKDFSRVKGKMLENVAQHFINRQEQFDAVIFGHTHKYSNGIVDRFQGKFIVENMCLCKPQKYADTGKLGYSPLAYGYTIVKYNDNESIDFNNIKSYFLKEIYRKEDDNKYNINLK